MFWGLWLFGLIRSAVGPHNHYITHPARKPVQLSPPPSVALLVVVMMMMCACSDSMTDPVPVYVWVWLICLIWVCPQGETQQLLLLLYILDSNNLTLMQSNLNLKHGIYGICCITVNIDKIEYRVWHYTPANPTFSDLYRPQSLCFHSPHQTLNILKPLVS